MSKRAVVLAGGWAHPPDDMAAAMSDLLGSDSFDVEIVTDPTIAPEVLGQGCDLVVVAACWFSMTDERYNDDQRAEFAVAGSPELFAALEVLRLGGCPLLALHTAILCFDNYEPWSQWLGGTWDWSRSWHPPPAALEVLPADTSLIDLASFQVIDEEYQDLDVADTSSLVASSAAGHPIVWLNETSLGRAAVNLLGHNTRSLAHPAHRQLNANLITWLMAP